MVKDKKWHDEKRARCIENYSSKTKMKSVQDWKVRIMKSNATQRSISDAVSIEPPRLCEYISLLVEPKDDKFYEIEAAIKAAE